MTWKFTNADFGKILKIESNHHVKIALTTVLDCRIPKHELFDKLEFLFLQIFFCIWLIIYVINTWADEKSCHCTFCTLYNYLSLFWVIATLSIKTNFFYLFSEIQLLNRVFKGISTFLQLKINSWNSHSLLLETLAKFQIISHYFVKIVKIYFWILTKILT